MEPRLEQFSLGQNPDRLDSLLARIVDRSRPELMRRQAESSLSQQVSAVRCTVLAAGIGALLMSVVASIHEPTYGRPPTFAEAIGVPAEITYWFRPIDEIVPSLDPGVP